MKTYGEIIEKEWDEMTEIEKNLNEIPLFTKDEFHDRFVNNDCYVWVSSKEGCVLMCQILDKFGYLNYSKKTKKKDKSYLDTDFWSLATDGILVFCPEVGVVLSKSNCLDILDRYDRSSEICKVRVFDDDSSFPTYYARFLKADKFGFDKKEFFKRRMEMQKEEKNRLNRIKRDIRDGSLNQNNSPEYIWLKKQVKEEDKEIAAIIKNLTKCRNRREEPLTGYGDKTIKRYIDGETVAEDELFNACVKYYLKY